MKPTPNSQVIPPLPSGVCLGARFRFASVLAALALAGALPAQTVSTPAEVKPLDSDKVVELDKVSVKGYRASLAQSLDDKRKANAIVDVITAEDAGKFPDTNLAESLSHLPGITIDRLFGDGERVSILGTDPNLNRTLLNGQPIATVDWYILDHPSRQFNYVLLAPEVIGKAEVYRSWEPRLLEGSIGGTIIVNTVSPLQGKPLSIGGSVTYTHNSLSKKDEPSFSGTASWHNAAKTLGVMVGAQDQKDYIRRDGVETLGLVGNYVGQDGKVVSNDYPQAGLPQAGTPGQTPTGPGNFVSAEVVNTALFLQLRHRQGANAAIEWKPSSKLEIDLTGLYVKEGMDNVNSSFYIIPFLGGGGTVSGVSGNLTGSSTGVLTGSTWTGAAQNEFDFFVRDTQIKTQVYNAKVTYTGDDVKIIGNFGDTRATLDATQYYQGGSSGAGANGHPSYWPNYTFTQGTHFASYSLQPTAPNSTLATNGDLQPSGSTGNRTSWGNLLQYPETDSEKWAQIDFEVSLKSTFLKKILFGMRSSEHNTAQDMKFSGPMLLERDLFNNTQAAPSNFLSGLPGITPTMANHAVANASLIRAGVMRPATSGTTSSWGLDGGGPTDVGSGVWPGLKPGETLLSYVQRVPFPDSNGYGVLPVFVADPVTGASTVSGLSNANAATSPVFNAKESINAAYVETDFADGDLSGNFGIRFVQTHTTGSSLNVVPWPTNVPNPGFPWNPAAKEADYLPVRQAINNTYDNILPALNLAYALGHDQVARFAMAEVISRPNLIQEFGFTNLYDTAHNGIGGYNPTYQGADGGPTLNPYKSTNIDLAYDWYFAKNSYVSADVFYKDISNYILNNTGRELHDNQTTWATNATYLVTRPQNGGSATSKGVSLAYQQAFDNGFGLQANYTYCDATGRDGPLPFASKNQINIGPYFENKLGLLRLTYSWRSDFATGSFNGSTSVITRPYTSIDVNAEFKITKNISLAVSARNLTNETYQQYYKLPNGQQVFAAAYKTGSIYSAGIHFSF